MDLTQLKTILIGESSAIKEVRELICQVAGTNATVLVMGESGTGKEMIARGIHFSSSRKNASLVPVNCGAIPKDLLESELFGHEKGAFSGAISKRKGRFELAHKGTLFLDEIGDMPADMQVKMLRVLQERVIERIGSEQSIKVDVRIVAATNRCLETAIQQGDFREDLYYRLNVFPILIPPLRHRKEDIFLLFEYFTKQYTFEGEAPIMLTDEASVELFGRFWKGNVRELGNLVECLSIRYPGKVITESMLPPERHWESKPNHCYPTQSATPPVPITPVRKGAKVVQQDLPENHLEDHLWVRKISSDIQKDRDTNDAFDVEKGINLKEHLGQIEISHIETALKFFNGNVSQAAKKLGLRRTTLVEKIKKYRIQTDA